MPKEKASFSARDPSPFTNGGDAPGKRKYMDVEKRSQTRRQAADRREEVRFDLTNEDRRKNLGRREDDVTANFW